MTLNIALNTIIIIMVFLFPGIIARKSFFSGPFKNRYESNSLVDKLSWNILCSLLALTVTSVIIQILFLLNNFFKVIDTTVYDIELKYSDLYKIFESLSNSKLPIQFAEFSNFTKYILYLLIVYFFSFCFGKILFYFVTKYNIERKFSIFQFRNHWEYLSKPNIYNFPDIDYSKNYDTQIDILVGEKDNKVLYRGYINKIIYDKENKIENIWLTNTIEFKRIYFDNEGFNDLDDEILFKKERIKKSIIHKLTNEYVVYKKIIKGDIFVIPASDFKNLNITYIETDKKIVDSITESDKAKKPVPKFLKYLDIKLFVLFITLSLLYAYFNVFFEQFIDNRFIDFIVALLSVAYILLLIIVIIVIYKDFNEKSIRVEKKIITTDFLITALIPLIGNYLNIPIVYSLTLLFAYSSISYLQDYILLKRKKYKILLLLIIIAIEITLLSMAFNYLYKNPYLCF